jgi:hypothetical protein
MCATYLLTFSAHVPPPNTGFLTDARPRSPTLMMLLNVLCHKTLITCINTCLNSQMHDHESNTEHSYTLISHRCMTMSPTPGTAPRRPWWRLQTAWSPVQGSHTASMPTWTLHPRAQGATWQVRRGGIRQHEAVFVVSKGLVEQASRHVTDV